MTPPSTIVVPIMMGSSADLDHAQAVARALDTLGVPHEMRIGSAHKTPAHVMELCRQYEADPRAKVFITIAGRSNALSAFIDGQVTAPVIACPPPSDTFGGADIVSSLRNPSGIASVVALDPGNAALAAAKMLGQVDPAVKARVLARQQAAVETVLQSDSTLLEAQGKP